MKKIIIFLCITSSLIFFFFSCQNNDVNYNIDIRKKNVSTPEKFVIKKLLPKKIKQKKLIYTNTLKGNIPSIKTSELASTGLLIDFDTKEVLWAKNHTKQIPIASMTKMMTLLVAMKLIKVKKLPLNVLIPVSKTSANIGGSQLYLDVRERFPLIDLLKGIAIKSANDASELVAEILGGGSSKDFVKKMNFQAKQLNLNNTCFYNVHGLPVQNGKDNYSTCIDLYHISEELLKNPLLMKWASTKVDYIKQNKKYPILKDRMLDNHNRVIGKQGIDGLKTGFTNNAGFCIAITAKNNNKRLIGVVTGFKRRKGSDGRDAFILKLLEWGYKQ